MDPPASCRNKDKNPNYLRPIPNDDPSIDIKVDIDFSDFVAINTIQWLNTKDERPPENYQQLSSFKMRQIERETFIANRLRMLKGALSGTYIKYK